jgi:hypothetical protein
MFSELVDVFGHKSNVSLVMDFMDTDLEVIIKDPTIILSPANIKSYILQTLLVSGKTYIESNVSLVMYRYRYVSVLYGQRSGGFHPGFRIYDTFKTQRKYFVVRLF